MEMAHVGIPVPPGLVISTEACNSFLEHNKLPDNFEKELETHLAKLGEATGNTFGATERPLLVSVRSGSPVSMPGMMDTILNLGLSQKNMASMIQVTQNERFVRDSYRRFIQMFSNVVLNIPMTLFEKALLQVKKENAVEFDNELTPENLNNLIERYLQIVKKETGQEFSDDPKEQLLQAILAVFRSWNNERAIFYRNLNHIPNEYGTAVSVQAMVFGNMGNDSATGVAFTRNPATGENQFYGEYLTNAQGEDVVAGIRTPKPIAELKQEMPQMYSELYETQQLLEKHFRDMQDIEFTIQQKKLYILQTRNGKRTGVAALRIAVEMVAEQRITKEQAILQVDPNTLPSLLAPIFDKQQKELLLKQHPALAIGLNAGPGCAAGVVVFDAEKAIALASSGSDGKPAQSVILVREETSPEDIIGMQHSNGVVTARGGMTSHAAVVARGMNKPCIVGCQNLHIDHENEMMTATISHNGKEIKKIVRAGEKLSIDGNTGEVMLGFVESRPSEIEDYLETQKEKTPLVKNFLQLLAWSDEKRRLKVRANADTPHDSRIARKHGAEGIGLCRTEHMFFKPECLILMQSMILARNLAERMKALEKILVFQRTDFAGIFEVMDGLPVTIRLLDPPLHEFLPHSAEQDVELGKALKMDPSVIGERVKELREDNPMLGHRGCRLGITFPEVTEMQVRAILEAAIGAQKQNFSVHPEIMVPLVGHVKELELQKEVIEKTANKVFAEQKATVHYSIGTMIEVPRAALQAELIAKRADFFSFGTNDLTQMTMAFSRDDAGVFLNEYREKNIYQVSPFQSIDVDGVGKLVQMAADDGRKAKPDLKLGICGEHGGDPQSIRFFNQVPLHYISCSPFRISVARLAAAQAALQDK